VLIIPAIFILSLAVPPLVLAHPLGDFVINRYSRLELDTEQIELFYVVDMAEVPTFQERPFIDKDDDGTFSPSEQQAYLAWKVAELQDNLHLELDGVPLPLLLQDQSIAFPPGDGGLDTMRLSAHFSAALPQQDSGWHVEYRDTNFTDRIGWQEVVIKPNASITLLETSAPTEELSNALTNYPENVAAPELTGAIFRFEPGALSGANTASVSVPAVASETSQSVVESEDVEFAALINSSMSSPGTIFFVLLAAFGWGAAHALTPGHGKTVVAAYLVGTRGTTKHALFLGMTTTVTHTAGVFAIGFLTLFASRYILPEQLYPWLAVGSGLLVVSIGLSLFRGRLAGLLHRPSPQLHLVHNHTHDDHDHGHHHEHTPHEHNHDHDSHDHDHSHHDHDHDSHDHDHAHAHDHDHDHDHTHDHGHSHLLHHHHGDGHTHSHAPPGADGTPVTWRSLLALGVSGGLIPCPAALVVMLSAIALQRVGFGMVLIVVFSLGLAGVLTGIGILWVKARELLNIMSRNSNLASRFPGGGGRLLQALPVISALFITLVGLGLTLQALIQTGVFGS
jgi:ABC-type nickel/cobalt efflux system permease component RcnA